jgi:hypothetical protein
MPEETPSVSAEQGQASAKSGNGTVLFKAIDPQGFEISLNLQTWEKHILVGHPEMGDLLELIKKTVVEPEIIQQSPRQPTSYYNYRLAGRKDLRRDDLFGVVIVNRDDESKTGFIKTAHLVDKLREGENIAWFSRTS